MGTKTGPQTVATFYFVIPCCLLGCGLLNCKS